MKVLAWDSHYNESSGILVIVSSQDFHFSDCLKPGLSF
jgi:hypothetical protein